MEIQRKSQEELFGLMYDTDANQALTDRIKAAEVRGEEFALELFGERNALNAYDARNEQRAFARDYLSGLDEIESDPVLTFQMVGSENTWLNRYDSALQELVETGTEEALLKAATARGAIETLVESYEAKMDQAQNAYIATLEGLEKAVAKQGTIKGPLFTEDKNSAPLLVKLGKELHSLDMNMRSFYACVGSVEDKYDLEKIDF